MKSLDEIMDVLVQENQIRVVELETEALSYPVVSKAGDRIVEKYFVFSNQPQSVKARPYAWIVVDTGSGKLLGYHHCALSDFAQETGIPPEREIDYAAPMEGTFREILAVRKRFSALYREVREFAFQEQIGREQLAVLTEYAMLHDRLFGKEVDAMYRALAPDFYDWMERQTTVHKDIREEKNNEY